MQVLSREYFPIYNSWLATSIESVIHHEIGQKYTKIKKKYSGAPIQWNQHSIMLSDQFWIHSPVKVKSLILYFCSCFWTTEGILLRRFFRPLHLCVSLLPLLKRKVSTLCFFDMCLPLGVEVKNGKDIQSKKHEYLRKQNVFQRIH